MNKAKLNTGDFRTNVKLEALAGNCRAEWIEPASDKVLLNEAKVHTGGAFAFGSPRYTQDVAPRVEASRP